MAWARLDIDLERGEALIEEIQSDWIKLALEGQTEMETQVRDLAQQQHLIFQEARGVEISGRRMHDYMNHVLADHMHMWEEAMMMAALWFLRKELGIANIFYHEYTSGLFMKGFETGWSAPPKSLYTRLPPKFCFTPSTLGPDFLRRDNSKKFCRAMKENVVRFWKAEYDGDLNSL